LKVFLIATGVLVFGSILLLGLGVAYLATYDNEDWERLAVRLVRAVTAQELTVDGEFSLGLSWHPTLTITDFSVTPADGVGASVAVPKFHRLELTLDLPRLHQGVVHLEHLRIDGAQVDWNPREQTSAINPKRKRKSPLILLVSDATVRDSQLIVRHARDPTPTVVALDSLRVKGNAGSDTLDLSGEGSVNGYYAAVTGQVGTVQEFFEPTGPFPVQIAAEVRGARFHAEGTVADPADGVGLELDLTAEAAEIADVIRLIRRDWPAMGPLHARARLVGNLPGAQLVDISVELDDGKGSRLRCTGSVADVSRGIGMALQFDGEVSHTARLHTLYGKPIPDLDRVTLKGRIAGAGDDLGVEDLLVTVDDDDLRGEVKGRVKSIRLGRNQPVAGVDLSLTARTNDLSTWSALAEHKLPSLGPLRLAARIDDQKGALRFSDVDLRVGDSAQDQLRLSGTVGKLTWAPRFAVSGVDLRLDGKAARVSHLFVSPPRDLPVEQTAQASGELTDADGSLGFEKAQLRVGSEETGLLQVTGGIDDLMNLREADLVLDLKLPNLAAVSPLLQQTKLLDRDLPAVGPVNGTMAIRDRAGTFGAEKIDVRIGSRQETWIRLAGEVGNLVARKDIDLTLDVSALDLADIGHLIGRDLPAIGPVSASGRLVDEGSTIRVEGLTVGLGEAGTQHVQATGSVRDLKTLDGLNLDLEIHLQDLALVEAVAGRPLPKAGPVTGTLEVVSKNGTASAREIDIRVGNPKTVWLNLEGRVGDVRQLRGVELAVDAGTAALPLLEPLVGRKLPDLGPVHASARLEDPGGVLAVPDFRVESGVPDRFELEVTGAFADLRALDELDVDVRLRGKDLSNLADLLAAPLPQGGPVDLTAHFQGSNERGKFDRLDLAIGRTKILGDVSYTMAGSKPEIVARLTSPLMHASDLYLRKPDPGTETGKRLGPEEAKEEGTPTPSGRRELLFRDDPLPLGWLRELNLDCTLTVDEFYVGKVRLDFVKVNLGLLEGDLHFKVLESVASGGSLKASLDIDARGEVPSFAATADLTGWTSGALQAQFVKEQYVEGQLDSEVDLRARGNSLREIMASMDGKIVSIMGGGTLRGIAIDLLAASLHRQLLIKEDPKAIPLNCAVEHLEIENGLATAQTILIDTDVSTLTGAGTIDLRRERIDIVLKPQPKQPKLATIKTPVSIRGDLADPTVTVESTSSFLKRLAKAVGLGIINPFAAVIPFMSTGSLDQHPCKKFLSPETKPTGRPPGAP
jgi:uncharacterized protein involved in outer membrane biogenesis